MRTIGIRVNPKVVTFAIFDTDDQRIVNIEPIKIPTSLSEPRKLRHVRTSILDVLQEYEVRLAGIRTTEPLARSQNTFRINIEGVIQEALATANLIGFRTGPSATIAAMHKVKPKVLTEYIAGRDTPDWAENWEQLNLEQREAVLIAVGVVNDNTKI